MIDQFHLAFDHFSVVRSEVANCSASESTTDWSAFERERTVSVDHERKGRAVGHANYKWGTSKRTSESVDMVSFLSSCLYHVLFLVGFVFGEIWWLPEFLEEKQWGFPEFQEWNGQGLSFDFDKAWGLYKSMDESCTTLTSWMRRISWPPKTEDYYHYFGCIVRSNSALCNIEYFLQMTKKMAKLDKETRQWKSKWEESNKALIVAIDQVICQLHDF